jgi:hypothetical protein
MSTEWIVALVWIAVSMVILFVGTYREADDMAVFILGIAWPLVIGLGMLFSPIWVPIALAERLRTRRVAQRAARLKAMRDVDEWVNS